METRFRRAVSCRASALPHELWQLILSFLSPLEAVQASLVCTDFAAVCLHASAQACRRLWPQHAHRLGPLGPGDVQRFLRLAQAHEAEAAAHPDVSKALQNSTPPPSLCPEHRQIAVEWLIEVSWDWQLENTVVYRGVQYLDHYLGAHAVPALSKFQMLAISCLRTALKHSSRLNERERQRLPCKHWAEVTDGACSEAEVRTTCTKLERMLQEQQRAHPNAKQRLRFLWYRLHDAGAVAGDQVYVYMLASFLLHLSLLDASLGAVLPTLLATAALSLALQVFCLPAMPPALAQHCFYLPHELEEVATQLRRAQEELAAPQLRALWLTSYSYTGASAALQPAYTHLQRIVATCGKLQALAGSSTHGSKQQADGKAAASPAAAAAAAKADARAQLGAPAAAAPLQGPANRVMTRAAAAAGLVSSQQRQQQQPAPLAASGDCTAAAAATAPGRADGDPCVAHTPTSTRGGNVEPSLPPAAPVGWAWLGQDAPLATPRPLQQQQPAQGEPFPPAPAAAGAADAGPSSSSAGRRVPTRELPPRRAVASSRYGMLTCRGGSGAAEAASPAQQGHSHADGAGGQAGSSSHAAAAFAGPPGRQEGRSHAGAAGTAAAPAAAADAAVAGPSSSRAHIDPPPAQPLATPSRPSIMGAEAAGPSSLTASAGPWPFAPCMTPASPKHAPSSSRGLAALFAAGGRSGGNSTWAAGEYGTGGGGGSSSARLLSSIPMLPTKPGRAAGEDAGGGCNASEAEQLQQQLGLLDHDPSVLLAFMDGQQHEASGSLQHRHSLGALGPLQQPLLPVLRSTRRAAATAAAHSSGDMAADAPSSKSAERLGATHTRSSSGDAGKLGGSSHMRPPLLVAGCSSGHHHHHHRRRSEG